MTDPFSGTAMKARADDLRELAALEESLAHIKAQIYAVLCSKHTYGENAGFAADAGSQGDQK